MFSDSRHSRNLGNGRAGSPPSHGSSQQPDWYPSYYACDYTDHMEKVMDEWEKLGFAPDGIYTGFLAGDVQAEMALEFIERFADSDTRILTDPILGDNGMEYPIYTEALCEKMRQLAEKASMITPNLTEALLLLYGKEGMEKDMPAFWNWMEGKGWNRSERLGSS